MILPFSTQLNGKPTCFIDKIWLGLLDNEMFSLFDWEYYYKEHKNKFGKGYDGLKRPIAKEYKGKIHTIRKDEKDRWEKGKIIDFFINARQKNMFRFAPKIPVVSTQEIRIVYSEFRINGKPALLPAVWIDNKLVYDYAGVLTGEMLKIANNDGFDSVVDFFAYFSEDFTGKIIHWTDFKY